MKVSQSSSLTSEPVPSVEMYSDPPSEGDIQWFNAQLNGPAPDGHSGTASEPGVVVNILQSLSGNQRAQKEAFHDLRVASRSSSAEDFSRANAQLSDYYIESLMNAKVIAKTVQSVDKISNLQ
ncbi:AraC family transcriptional regulator [Pantoea sp. EKM101V]|uniref:EscI/YscI/HrpB family type III secretion system inner rod protein n=1 Tax=Pantoea sp. EKM101V TaxID=1683695 RepID=UPI00142DACEB|nr:EscI/YscI/HrpB family type III secretion system inner rod protein [Pantoea sp. EKM101V]KAF6669328.1 AraC family transcriptional regulator [Pantoea sp. EKM101V]